MRFKHVAIVLFLATALMIGGSAYAECKECDQGISNETGQTVHRLTWDTLQGFSCGVVPGNGSCHEWWTPGRCYSEDHPQCMAVENLALPMDELIDRVFLAAAEGDMPRLISLTESHEALLSWSGPRQVVVRGCGGGVIALASVG